MSNKFKANKKSLNYKQSVASWNRGTKRKLIAEPSSILTKTTRGGLILT